MDPRPTLAARRRCGDGGFSSAQRPCAMLTGMIGTVTGLLAVRSRLPWLAARVVWPAAPAAPPTRWTPPGVDGLKIPTPSPTRRTSSTRVDNPWFPLAPGTVWTYRTTSADGRRDRRRHRHRPHQGRRRASPRRSSTTSRRTPPARSSRTPSTGTPRTPPATSGTSARTPRRTTARKPEHRGLLGGRRRRRARPGWRCRPSPGSATATPRSTSPGVAEDRARSWPLDEHRERRRTATYDDVVQTEDTTPARARPGRAEVLRPRRRRGHRGDRRRRRGASSSWSRRPALTAGRGRRRAASPPGRRVRGWKASRRQVS